jgi:hypothetical protein
VPKPCPNLLDVLAAVVPGRVARLNLTAEQKQAFRDHDGRVGLDVVRHLEGARIHLGCQPGRFSLTEGAFQATARKLGHEIGQKRCRAVIHRLTTEILSPAGSYRQKYKNTGTRSGYRVKVYRLTTISAEPVPSRRKTGFGGGRIRCSGHRTSVHRRGCGGRLPPR